MASTGERAKFVGYAAPGESTANAVWRVLKLIYNASDDVVEVLWADGDTNFDNVWDNRAVLSYS